MPPLLLISNKNSFWENFILGLFAWFPYCVVGFYWVLHYNVWTYLDILMSHLPFLGLWLGFTGLIVKRFPGNILLNFLTPPVVWNCLSFLYDLTPLGAVGTQVLFYQPIPWMQAVRIFGVYGIVFLFLMLNASVALIFKLHSKARFVPLIFAILLLTADFFYGQKALADTFVGKESVALIQHNLPVSETWWNKNQGYILNHYRSLALEAAKEKPKLIVLPSYALPFDAYRDQRFFGGLARETNAFILVSTYIPKIANRSIDEVGQYEVALLYSPKGQLAGVNKAVEAPPFRKIHEVLAKENELLATPFAKIGTLLCFEDVLSRRAKAEAKMGAELLVALSNPGHFTKTFLPEYHLFQDQLRAIETGLFVIRVSANGYSAIIDPRGRIVKHTQLGKQEILYGEVAK